MRTTSSETALRSDPASTSVGTGADTSSPRLFFVGMAAFMLALVVAGFWPTYFGRLLSGLGPSLKVPIAGMPWVIHLHAAVFLGWMAVLLTQATLIARGKTRAHMKLGRFGDSSNRWA